MLAYPHIDPVALHIGPVGLPVIGQLELSIRWYALAYLAGVMLGWWLIGLLNKRMSPPPLSKDAFDDLMVYGIFGIVLGGRLGYVLFYNPSFYFTHPLQIPMIWHGGMSFHGGLTGMIIASFLFARRYGIPFLTVTDLLAVVAPIGLFFGRLANFINGELYGRVTTGEWGMIFPTGGPLPRYPSQLLEASLEGLLLFLILVPLAFRTRAIDRRGLLSGLFLTGYSIARTIGECFREPDYFIGYLPGGCTMGQVLCLPMLVLGLYLLVFYVPRHKTA